MLNPDQYRKILSLEEQGNSIRNISRLTGHSRNTIRKALDIRTPSILSRKSIRPSKLDEYKDKIKAQFDIGTYTAKEMYIDLIDNGYDGSYSTVRKYLSKLHREKDRKTELRTRPKQKKRDNHKKWLLNLLQGKFRVDDLERKFGEFIDSESVKELYQHVLTGSLRYRNRALTAFAYLNKIPKMTIAEFLGAHRKSVRSYIVKFESGGTKELFDFSRKAIKKFEEPKYRDKVFQILHSPPSYYGFNRTTWRMEDLYQTMSKEGCSLAKSGIRKIIKKEGYRFVKARKVLTSKDPLYREKIKEITSILSNLKPNEKFFSIDEYGPFAVKMQGGKSLLPPGVTRTVPQWQKSKGSIIITAALELSTNQIFHFYSGNKNTNEMIKLLNLLVEKYSDEECIYLSWDSASWHASNKLYKRVDKINSEPHKEEAKSPDVKLAPLPTCAQFLNVIESVFSGMARAIIHNSDYESVDDCKLAINRYFQERNKHFQKHPKRAGKKIWGKERVKAHFSESNNCKDPMYR